MHTLKHPPEKFGTLLGHAPGGVAIYSSHYPSASKDEDPDREAYRSELDGVYMGYKWQCVEFARILPITWGVKVMSTTMLMFLRQLQMQMQLIMMLMVMPSLHARHKGNLFQVICAG